jgi:indole-3-glycerol phosphate synthase
MSLLAEIVDSVERRLEETKRERPLARVRADAEAAPRRPPLAAALDAAGTSLIAEAKRRSPSRGVLREPYDAAELALQYVGAGARAVSVLTEPQFFGGSPEDLAAVRDACAAPILRKDFVVDPYQVFEARAWGASAVLLIVASLDDARLADLRSLASELGLDALVEVHTEREAERALAAGAAIVGVNNRDLATFRTDRSTTARIARTLPRGTRVVAESGIANRADVLEVERGGACAVLVGEALVTAPDPAAKVRELLGTGARP